MGGKEHKNWIDGQYLESGVNAAKILQDEGLAPTKDDFMEANSVQVDPLSVDYFYAGYLN